MKNKKASNGVQPSNAHCFCSAMEQLEYTKIAKALQEKPLLKAIMLEAMDCPPSVIEELIIMMERKKFFDQQIIRILSATYPDFKPEELIEVKSRPEGCRIITTIMKTVSAHSGRANSWSVIGRQKTLSGYAWYIWDDERNDI